MTFRQRNVGAKPVTAWLAVMTMTMGLATPVPRVIHGGAGELEDRALFEGTVRILLEERYGTELRVDPQPLRIDPALVTLHAFTLMPDKVPVGSWLEPFASVGDSIVEARRDVLRRSGVPEVTGIPVYECPSNLMPFRTREEEEHARRGCPQNPFRVAFIALPREGGSFWPRNSDGRAKYAGRDVFSVRVILRHYSPHGGFETSEDLLFERKASDWTHLERVKLLIVE